ncbi:MAG TPA: GerW family sporulation protein [Candidatus Gemmiger stercorigallinarum]|nr:GerW family sporulation protein [Candidatus Gemmiger stercorigallinarum]
MAEHPVQGLMGATVEKIREMADANTIIGTPISIDANTTIIPVSKVTMGFASGGSDMGAKATKEMFGGGSGAGVSITPIAFLVVTNGTVRTVQLAEHVSPIDNAINALPELVDKLAAMLKKDDASGAAQQQEGADAAE